jgi:formate hydrogenlyase subunit 6/NADH:ubiquinone oxidoreductase subunit I
MFKILESTFRTGKVTAAYPERPAVVSPHFRGRPQFDFERWADARPAAAACPTGAIGIDEGATSRRVTIDYGRCNFCGLCAGPGVTVTLDFELAARSRQALIQTAEYALTPFGTHAGLVRVQDGSEKAGEELKDGIHKLLGRSLAIRQVDAGSCNG